VGDELVPREFLARPAPEVAPGLLGCVLEHETGDGLVAVTLTEVEAYNGAADPASHAYRGRTGRNAVMFGPSGHAYVYFTYGMHFCVNVVCMPAGTASAVLLRAGRVIAGEELARRRRAVRGRGPDGTARDLARVPDGAARDLARGPARLCQALGIDRRLDGADLCDPASPLRLLYCPAGTRSPHGGLPPPVPRDPSVPPVPSGLRDPSVPPVPSGLRDPSVPRDPSVSSALPGPAAIHAGPRVGVREGADVPWRFWLDGEPTVSVYRPHVPKRR
jgi:DNA-3-methyladenine glycosylase